MAITKTSRRPSQNQSPRTKGKEPPKEPKEPKETKGKSSTTSSGSSGGGNLYTHSSPPKVLQMNSSNIRQWLKAGDLEKLEDVIIDGQGQKLLKESSADDKTRAFLRSVPDRISKMDAIHKVVEEGDLRQTKNLLDRRKYAMSRDKNGVSLLHKAVMNGRTEVAEYLASTYPEILNLTDAETAVVTLRRIRRPERQMAAYQRHLLRMQKRRSSVVPAGGEAAAPASGTATGAGTPREGRGSTSDGAAEVTGVMSPLQPAGHKPPGHKTRPKVVTHWEKTPGEEEKSRKNSTNDKKDEGDKKEKRKGTGKKRASTGKSKTADVVNKDQEKDSDKQKKKKPKKKVRMSEEAPKVADSSKPSVSKWAGIHAALKLWQREPVPEDQLESVPVPGPDGEEHHVKLRRPPPLTMAFEGLRTDDRPSSLLAEAVDGWRAQAHGSAVWPAMSAQLVASLLTEVVDEEAGEMLQDELSDELARRLVERVLDRAQLVAQNRHEHAEAVRHIFLSNMGNIVTEEEQQK